MWIAIETVDENDIDKSATDRGIDLCEAVAPDLGGARGCLETISTGGNFGGFRAATYHHHHANYSTGKLEYLELAMRI